MRPCKHTTVLEPGQPYQPGTCRICWLYWNSQDHRTAWDAAGPEAHGSCRFLGRRVRNPDRTIKTKDCFG